MSLAALRKPEVEVPSAADRTRVFHSTKRLFADQSGSVSGFSSVNSDCGWDSGEFEDH